jgi:hypothetical protein
MSAVGDTFLAGKPIKQRYSLHWARQSIRSTCTLFYILSVILYIVDGTQCSTDINNINNEDDGFEQVDSSICWMDPLNGDLRPMLSVTLYPYLLFNKTIRWDKEEGTKG